VDVCCELVGWAQVPEQGSTRRRTRRTVVDLFENAWGNGAFVAELVEGVCACVVLVGMVLKTWTLKDM